jgi:hypothetical protein
MKITVKHLIASILIFTIALAPLAKAQTAADKISIAISKGSVIIDGTKFVAADKFFMGSVEKILGKADRVKDGFNRLHTYDKLGVVFFENTTTHTVNEVQIFIVLDKSLEFCPKIPFRGLFKIEKLAINSGTNLDVAKKKLKKYKFEKSLLDDNSYRGESKNVYAFIRFSTGNKGAEKLSFGIKEPKK